MKKKLIYELKSLYRDSLRVYAYEFGEGEESVCIVGALRGNEVQQMYICSLLIERLKIYEQNNCITKNKKNRHNSLCQHIFHEPGQTLLAAGRYGYKPHVSGILCRRNDTAHS